MTTSDPADHAIITNMPGLPAMRMVPTPRCTLEPLCASHAEAMFAVLSDSALYELENAPPASVDALRDRYQRLESRQSPDGQEHWLNWVLRLPSGDLAGYVQATVLPGGRAWVAYELASRHWRQGIGSTAVQAMLQELADHHGVHTAVAALKARNHRSAGLLRHLGFHPGLPPDGGLGPIDEDEIAFHRPLTGSKGNGSTRRGWPLAILAAVLLPALALAQAPSDLVIHTPGTLPLVLTVPHDGDQPVGLTPVRRQGTTVRDLGTRPVAEQVADLLAQQLGQRPCVVIARFSRRFVDANRSEAEALESDGALPAYRAYHAAVAGCVAQARAQHPQGALLVDVHGQGQAPTVLFRGTRAGLTTRALLARLGPTALQGPDSLIGLLAAKGYTVHPPIGSDSLREDPRFAGGYTVATYGSHQPDGIDAIQLELGREQRQNPQLPKDLADALATVLRQQGYLAGR